jgi:predicted MFS family arabinose efflux permease
MRIAKPILLVATPIGLAFGLYEGWRLAGGLVVIMAMMILLVGAAMMSVVLTVRREKRAETAARDKNGPP